eukprot:scaffold26619_cov126-Skeletonema_menzelii.AAC.2
MSDFASLLSSFKQDASAVSAASKSPLAASVISQERRQQNKPSRKRPFATTTTSTAPHFPSMHSNNRKKSDFKLTWLGIGAQKAGTTWLHKLLRKCDDISLPHEQKEVHFWDWHHRKGFEWYIRQFGYHSQKASAVALHYGEITPCYVVLPETTIAEIHKCFPNLKIIFVARDLVDRAWSAMIMELRDQTMGLSAGDFADGVTGNTSNNSNANKRAKLSAAQQRRLEQQSSPSSQPDSYFRDRLRDATHDSRSNYAKHLINWYKYFPSSSILLIDYREIESNPRDVLLKVVMHIGVEEEKAKQFIASLNDDEVGQRINAATTSVSSASTGSSPTSSHQLLTKRPMLKKQLEKYLQPYAREFNDLLKIKGYDWRLDEYDP